MSDRCEPPPELQASEGWHWLQRQFATYPVRWTGRDWDMSVRHAEDAYERGYRYLSPVATPAEVEALRAENARWRLQSDDWQKRGWELGGENDTLRARVARLEEALDGLVMACELPGDHCEVDQALPAARAALSAETP